MRVVVDCRQLPSDVGCSLTIAGEEEEVLRAATRHAVEVHGHADSLDLREQVQASMQPEGGDRIAGYGTTMVGRLAHGSLGEVVDELDAWERDRRVPGFLGAQVLLSDDGTIVNTAVFTDVEAYRRLADDPGQDAWYREHLAPRLDGEPQWIDGHWAVYYRRPAIRLPEQSTGAGGGARVTTTPPG